MGRLQEMNGQLFVRCTVNVSIAEQQLKYEDSPVSGKKKILVMLPPVQQHFCGTLVL